ncbi:hypothetical protein KP509_30G060500 [Ceratopteris richardii]|uniref:Calcineurin-like phosphoesterase domain-containing protein n=1 Tax=Ceratopteris richardii TaxID=49495 RepID=A0A8T2R4I9_CERRI|nr:hypothetical protein KP509_30G060500 [Ceratopteris richardii]
MNGVGGGWDCSPCLTMGVGENPLTLGNSWTNRELQAFRACRNSYGRSFLPATCMSKDRLGHDKRARRIMPAVVPVPQALPKDASSMRVFVISDLHTDYTENMAWVKKISSATFKQDTLIVAGDVAETLKTFEKTMALLKDRFRHVFFIPGNHDLWCRNVGSEKHMHSLEKLRRILNICRNLGVETEPKLIKRVGIIPLFSWYHQSFDKEPDIPGYKFPPLKLVCRDFQACKWHSPCSNIGDKLAIYFDNLNLEFWAAVEELTSNADQIISFSHFLPRFPSACISIEHVHIFTLFFCLIKAPLPRHNTFLSTLLSLSLSFND